MRRERNGRPWRVRDVALLGGLIAVWAWAFAGPLRDVLTLALRDGEQSHILLAPLVAAWLLWLRRSRFRGLRVRMSPAGSGLVAMGCVLTLLGLHFDVHLAWHAGALVALLGVLATVAGITFLRRFAVVIGALLFMIPIPATLRQEVALPLQSMATALTCGSLEAIGVQAVRSGNVLIIGGEQVAVAEACNGMRLVMALGLVTYAFVFSTPLRPGARLVLLLLSPAVALLANVLRLVPTSLLYGAMSAERAERFHDLSGWLMLPLALLVLVALVRLFRWLEFPVRSYRLACP